MRLGLLPGGVLGSGGPSTYVIGVSRALSQVTRAVDLRVLLLGIRQAQRRGSEERAQVARLLGPPGRVDVRGRPVSVRLLTSPLRSVLPSYDVLFGRHDVYHQTHLDLDPRIPGNKLVLTVHDLIAANWPDEGSLLPGAEALLARAAALITVSAASRDAILGRFRSVEPGKVHVIWNGVDHAAFHAKKDERDAERLRELGVESTFLLYVGGLTRRKNVSTLLKAQRRLRASSNDIPTLVLVGPWSSDLLARQPPEAGVLALGNVPTDVVPALMRHAVAVVVPSREEGFGLPVLEAQACGTVVVCSDIPVFREVGGEAPIFIDTTTPDSLASGLGMALQLPERERAHRVENGLRHVVEFTWRRSAVRHLDVYEAVQGERER